MCEIILYQKILVPYDNSKPADKALDHAINIAKLVGGKDKSEVILLHVIEEYQVSPFIDIPVRSPKTGQTIRLSQFIKEVYEMMVTSTMDALQKKKEEVKRSTDFEITIKVYSGHVSNTVLGFAEKERVDLIIIGNAGLSGISKIKALGSISRAVSERASCPVMIVH